MKISIDGYKTELIYEITGKKSLFEKVDNVGCKDVRGEKHD